MNECLHHFLEAIASTLAVPQLVLYDYDETAGVFELLYFSGYPANARAELARRLHRMNLQRALRERNPYWLDESHEQLIVPLYFHDTLEAVLLMELDGRWRELDEERRAACKLVSKFLGLFMSSNRLPVNQRQRGIVITDLERAREVQMTYLPAEHPVTDRYEIYGYNLSSALVGGDYFDYFCAHENSIQGVIADACGHGLAAALIMSTFRGLLHADVKCVGDPASLFTRINQKLYTGVECLQYLTSVLFSYDAEAGELRYVNAGHLDPLVICADGSCLWLTGGGPPLGMFEESSYELESCQIGSGDLLVLFTDGLAEMRNAEDHFFGREGIAQTVGQLRHLPLKQIATEVLTIATSFSHSPRPEDDLTLFLMRIH